MESEVSHLISAYLQDLYSAGMTEDSTRKEVLAFIPQIREWARKYLLSQPQVSQLIECGLFIQLLFSYEPL